ncbi:MAG: hypothetical protein MUF78_04950 [Candidatus Edwardsbacteria bacterium]|jgi:hypothetical protein|nr:hypothetical protein [Candidatus Edwardsbacteria bacterium]
MRRTIELTDVRKAAAGALERLCGLQSREGGAACTGPVDAAAEVQFWGAFQGRLMVQLSDGLGQVLAARLFHAVSPAIRQQKEAAAIAAAVICGTLLGGATAHGRTYLMESPCIIDNVNGYEKLFSIPQARVALATTAGVLEVRIYANAFPVSGPPPAPAR